MSAIDSTVTAAVPMAPVDRAASVGHPDRSPRLDSLTGLRFLAAALVLLHHVSYFLIPTGPFAAIFGSGFVGVTFFFVLSGFVLAWVHDERTTLRQFWARRFARIYPLHLATALIAVPVVLALGQVPDVKSSIANLLLVQAWVPREAWGASLNGASWSLACEAFFYASFPLLFVIVSRTRFRFVALITCVSLIVVAILVLQCTSPETASGLLYKGPWYRIGEFVLGVGLAVAMRRGFRFGIRLRTAAIATVASYIGVSLAVSLCGHVGIALPRVAVDLAVVPSACVLIAVAASSDLRGQHGWLSSRLLVRLGEASFALYMIHFLLLQVWTRFVPSDVPAWMSAVFAVALSILVGVAAHRYLERPAERLLRARLGGTARPSGRPVTATMRLTSDS